MSTLTSLDLSVGSSSRCCSALSLTTALVEKSAESSLENKWKPGWAETVLKKLASRPLAYPQAIRKRGECFPIIKQGWSGQCRWLKECKNHE